MHVVSGLSRQQWQLFLFLFSFSSSKKLLRLTEDIYGKTVFLIEMIFPENAFHILLIIFSNHREQPKQQSFSH